MTWSTWRARAKVQLPRPAPISTTRSLGWKEAPVTSALATSGVRKFCPRRRRRSSRGVRLTADTDHHRATHGVHCAHSSVGSSRPESFRQVRPRPHKCSSDTGVAREVRPGGGAARYGHRRVRAARPARLRDRYQDVVSRSEVEGVTTVGVRLGRCHSDPACVVCGNVGRDGPRRTRLALSFDRTGRSGRDGTVGTRARPRQEWRGGCGRCAWRQPRRRSGGRRG
jgi:hypothetical protein